MTEAALTIGCALLAFGPLIALFALIVYQKAQLVIVVTSSAFFFLLGATCAGFTWFILDLIGLGGPLAAIIPGVFFQFLARCAFVGLYHRVENVIAVSIRKHHEEELRAARGETADDHETDPATDASIRPDRGSDNNDWAEMAKMRLELNDASCGIAAGVGFGGMHAVMLYGTLLASETTDNAGVLYQDSCPGMPSLVVSAIFCLCFSILDMFWMLFTFFGMRRRLIFHRGDHAEDEVMQLGSWLGNSRMGGNFALLIALMTHFLASLFTTTDYFNWGCSVSLPTVGAIVLVTAYIFWAGVGRIYMPPTYSLSRSSSRSRMEESSVPSTGNPYHEE